VDYNRQYPYQEDVTEVIQLINSSLNLEVLVAEYYDWLINNIPIEGLTIPQRKEISDRLIYIRDRELEHIEAFKQIYRDFTGREPEIQQRDFAPPQSFAEGIKTGLFEEANSVVRYREIKAKIPGDYYDDILFNIVTDELIQMNLFNYIYTTVMNINPTTENRSRRK
jgi:rubrerythrin